MTIPILTISADEYHAASRRGEFVSSHLLDDFRNSPELYRRKISGEINDSDTPSLALGRAAHCLILEGKTVFDEQYTVSDGPINPKTGEVFGKNTKAYAEWLARQDKNIISGKDCGFVTKLYESVACHNEASRLLSSGWAEGVIRAEYCGVPCQIRMDWFSERNGLVDLKTCECLRWFENDCRRFGYILQMAFYRAVIREATGWTVPVHFIAVEKNEPFSTGVWRIASEALDDAERVNAAALARFRECRNTGHWPTGYEEIRTITNM